MSGSRVPCRSPILASVGKSGCVVGFFLIWGAVYDWTNAHGSDPRRTIHFTRPADVTPWLILPWSAWIYVLGGLALPVLPFFYYWSFQRLRLVLACYAIGSAIAFACYWIWPVSIIRPEYTDGGMGETLLQGVFAVDRPGNCTPSSHVFFAILSALLINRSAARPAVRAAVWLLAAAVSLTTITTGQHYWIDVAAGAALAVVTLEIGNRLVPASRAIACATREVHA